VAFHQKGLFMITRDNQFTLIAHKSETLFHPNFANAIVIYIHREKSGSIEVSETVSTLSYFFERSFKFKHKTKSFVDYIVPILLI
jgi:hypothetical protein